MQSIAIISETAVISNPVSRGTPEDVPPKPAIMRLNTLLFMSITRFQVVVLGSRSKELVLL